MNVIDLFNAVPVNSAGSKFHGIFRLEIQFHTTKHNTKFFKHFCTCAFKSNNSSGCDDSRCCLKLLPTGDIDVAKCLFLLYAEPNYNNTNSIAPCIPAVGSSFRQQRLS